MKPGPNPQRVKNGDVSGGRHSFRLNRRSSNRIAPRIVLYRPPNFLVEA
jgi:hypothetical protein